MIKEFYLTAAEQGNADAQFSLGVMCEFGIGVKKDVTEARKWFDQAVKQGHAKAKKFLSRITSPEFKLDDVVDDLAKWYCAEREKLLHSVKHSEQLTEDLLKRTVAVKIDAVEQQRRQERFEKYHRLAEQGDAKAQRKLGNMYKNGRGVEKNEEEAKKWYDKSVESYLRLGEQGDADARWELGMMYDFGFFVAQDKAKAKKWYIKAMESYRRLAEQGNFEAQYFLGVMHDIGCGLKKNEEAEKWFNQIEERGDLSTKLRLARYRVVSGGKNVQKALKLLLVAARENDEAREWLESL